MLGAGIEQKIVITHAHELNFEVIAIDSNSNAPGLKISDISIVGDIRNVEEICKIAQKYSSELNIESKIPFDKNCSYHLYWILVKNREKFRKRLSENGIETGTHYKPIHQMSMYKNEGKLPITDSVGKKIVTIPIHPNLKNSEIEKIISIVNKFSYFLKSSIIPNDVGTNFTLVFNFLFSSSLILINSRL